MNIHPANRLRGIVSARADADVNATLRELNTVFGAFRANNDNRLESLEQQFNSQRETIDALRMNGAGIHPGAGLRAANPVYPVISGAISSDFHAQLRGLPSASMTTQSGPDGGFTVAPQIDGTIDALLRDLSPMRTLSRVVPQDYGTGDWQKIIGRSGSANAWVGEEEARGDTSIPTLGIVTVPCHELYALPELTNQLLDDAGFDINAFLAEDVATEFALAEGTAFVSGDGVKKPHGFLSYPVATTADSARAFGTVQYVATGNAGAFAASNPVDALFNLLTALRPIYRKGDGVAWLMNSTTANVIRKFKDSTGQPLWANSIVAGQPDRLLGYAVAIDEGMPDIAADSYSVAFGNWRRGYAIVDKPDVRLIVDRVTKKGWTKAYFSKRVGGGVTDSNAIKLLKFAAS